PEDFGRRLLVDVVDGRIGVLGLCLKSLGANWKQLLHDNPLRQYRLELVIDQIYAVDCRSLRRIQIHQTACDLGCIGMSETPSSHVDVLLNDRHAAPSKEVPSLSTNSHHIDLLASI